MHLRTITLLKPIHGFQTRLSIKVNMPRCLSLPRTMDLLFALERLTKEDCIKENREFTDVLCRLYSWTEVVCIDIHDTAFTQRLDELLQRGDTLLS
jgi:hypothetical protein